MENEKSLIGTVGTVDVVHLIKFDNNQLTGILIGSVLLLLGGAALKVLTKAKS